MTPEEERDYQEALRRIQEAKTNNSVDLDLGGTNSLPARTGWHRLTPNAQPVDVLEA